MKFSTNELHWRLKSKKKMAKKVIDVLNSLTPEQVDAVKTYGDSRYDVGYDKYMEDNRPLGYCDDPRLANCK